jgi:hypothetical protein
MTMVTSMSRVFHLPWARLEVAEEVKGQLLRGLERSQMQALRISAFTFPMGGRFNQLYSILRGVMFSHHAHCRSHAPFMDKCHLPFGWYFRP